jgi:hypothetical protein
LGLSDPEEPSVEYESIFSERLEKVIRTYPQVSSEIARLSRERIEAVNCYDLEKIRRIDEEISGLRKLVKQNFKESFILFIKSGCPIF